MNDGTSVHTPLIANWAEVDLPVDWRSHLGARGLLVALIHGTWCPPCLEQITWLQRRYSWLVDQGVGILAVSADNPAHIDAFHRSLERPLPFAFIADERAAFSRALGLYDEAAGATRSTLLLVDCTGRVRFRQSGQHEIPTQTQLAEHIERMEEC